MQAISVKHTRELFGGNLGILFYDVTTLYFETTESDELRESGFSKDGKNANAQVVLGLLVSRGGEGNIISHRNRRLAKSLIWVTQ